MVRNAADSSDTPMIVGDYPSPQRSGLHDGRFARCYDVAASCHGMVALTLRALLKLAAPLRQSAYAVPAGSMDWQRVSCAEPARSTHSPRVRWQIPRSSSGFRLAWPSPRRSDASPERSPDKTHQPSCVIARIAVDDSTKMCWPTLRSRGPRRRRFPVIATSAKAGESNLGPVGH